MCQISIHAAPIFEGFLGPYSSMHGLIFLKFAPEIVFLQIKTVFEKPLKNLIFYKNGTDPKFALLVQLLAPVTP